MDCRQAKDLLSAYLENDLDQRQKDELEGHLFSCAHCQAELKSLRTMLSELGKLQNIKAPKDFLQGVRSRLGMEPKKEPFIRRFKVPLEAVGVAASVILIVYFVNQGGYMQQARQTMPAQTAPMPTFGNALVIPEEEYLPKQEIMDYGIDAYQKGMVSFSAQATDEVDKVKEIVESLGGSIQKEEEGVLYIKIPEENLQELSEKTKEIKPLTTNIISRDAEAVDVMLDLRQAQ